MFINCRPYISHVVLQMSVLHDVYTTVPGIYQPWEKPKCAIDSAEQTCYHGTGRRRCSEQQEGLIDTRVKSSCSM